MEVKMDQVGGGVPHMDTNSLSHKGLGYREQRQLPLLRAIGLAGFIQKPRT